jgi:hypothetical protein
MMENRKMKRPLKTLMQIGTIPNPYEIKSADVGTVIDYDFGKVTPVDVGKRIYLRGGVIQMENEEQRADRLLRGRK